MSDLLVWKEKLQRVYAKYSLYIDKGIRFVLALISFILISSNIGFMQKLTNPFISVVLAVICAFLPLMATVLIASALMLIHMYSLSMGVAAIAAVILLIMFIFYFRVTPNKAIILLLTPLAFALKVPLLIPIAYGLVGTPAYIVSAVCGTIVYFLVNYTKTFATTLKGTKQTSLLIVITRFAKQIFQNKEMWIVILATVVCLLLVYTLRKKSMEQAWKIAIISGAAAYILILVAGNFVLDIKVNYVALILGSIVSIAVGLLLELMIFSVDYSGTEYLQFEDDEYYYYVKAVPKVSVAVPEKKVKRIYKRQDTEVSDLKKDEIDRLIEQELMK